jgi:hypothetical protein
MGRGQGWRRGYRFLDPGAQRRALVMLDEGMSCPQVGAVFGVSRQTIARLRDEAWLRRRRVLHSRYRLSWEERERIRPYGGWRPTAVVGMAGPPIWSGVL